jgi:hypothetical protein
MGTGGHPSSFRWSRFVSLSLGVVAVVMLSMFPYGDWVYDEWELSAIETSTIVGAALAWLLARAHTPAPSSARRSGARSVSDSSGDLLVRVRRLMS